MESTTTTTASSGSPMAEDLDAVPAPWDYNPSSWRQRIPICLIATAGFGIAVYLALYQRRFVDGVWDPISGKLGQHAPLGLRLKSSGRVLSHASSTGITAAHAAST